MTWEEEAAAEIAERVGTPQACAGGTSVQLKAIPEDIRSAAEALCNRLFRIGEHIGAKVHFDPAGLIAEALMAERGAQRDRVFTMLSGIADLLAKRMTDSATPELLKALASAVHASDEPEPSEFIRSPDTAGTPHG